MNSIDKKFFHATGVLSSIKNSAIQFIFPTTGFQQDLEKQAYSHGSGWRVINCKAAATGLLLLCMWRGDYGNPQSISL